MNSVVELFNTIILNFIDLLMLFYLCHKVLEKKISPNNRDICIGATYTIIVGVIAHFLDGYTYRFIVTSGMLIIIKYISRRKLYDILLLYIIIFINISIVQIIVLSIVSFIPINDVSLIGQLLSLILAVIIYHYLPIHKLLQIIEKQLLLKLCLIIVIGIVMFIIFYFENNYSDIRIYSLYFGIFVTLILLGLFHTLKNIFFYTSTVPMQLHDVKNVLMGLSISAQSTSSIDILRNDIKKALEIIGMDNNILVSPDNYTKNIISFITQKNTIKIPIIHDIQFYELNEHTPLSMVLFFLGLLLDNALESGTNKALYIRVSIAEESILVSVSNEYKRKSNDDFQNMFKKGHSTKSSNGRGYGLYNLSRIVAKQKGEILVDYNFRERHKCNYLTITIKI